MEQGDGSAQHRPVPVPAFCERNLDDHPFSLNGAVMDKYISAAVALDKNQTT